MADKFEKALIDEVKQRVRKEYGQAVLNKALQDHHLENDVLDYAERAEMSGVGDIAGFFLEVMHPRLQRLGDKSPTKKPKVEKFIAPQRGSLQNVAAYAAVLPLVLEARRRVFGQTHPLSYEDALAWLREESKHEPLQVVEVTFRFRVPAKDVSKLREPAIGGDGQKMIDNFRASNIAVDSPMGNGTHKESSYRQIYDEVGRESFRIGSAEGAALVEWAEFVADMCGGFDEAAWLILTGRWERLGLRGRHGTHPLSLDKIKAVALGSDYRFNNGYAMPFVELSIGELETTPDEVKSYYAQIRKRYGYGTKGQAMSYRTEVLALIAIELQETEGVNVGDGGFYKRVLKVYAERAALYGLEFDSTMKEEDVRKALKGAESAYNKMVSSQDRYYGYSPHLFKST